MKIKIRITIILISVLCIFNGLSTPGAYAATANGYVANKENLRSFFETVSSYAGKPTIVSKLAMKKQISGNFDLTEPYALIERLSAQMGLIWYDDGKAIYIYDSSEMRNALINLRKVSTNEFNNFLKKSGLYNSRYEIKGGGNGTFYVSGPPVYVDLVVNAAKLMEQNSDGIEIGRNKVGIIHLVNTFVNDRTYELRGEKIVIPGMAKVLSTLLNNNIKQSTGVNVLSEISSRQQLKNVSRMPPFPGAEEDDDLQVEKIISTAGAPETDDIQIIAYPDTNSLLVKGTVSQVDFIEKLVATLDIPKRHIELSLWIIDIDKTDLEQLGADWSGTIKIGSSLSASFNNSGSISTLDGTQFIATIQALAQKRRAAVVARPVVLTQENIPAIFDNNRTFYTKLVGERTAELDEVTYGTMISVLPRFAARNQIELLLNIEDGNEINSDKTNVDDLPQVGRTLISTIARVPQGKSLLIGGYTRDTNTYESRKIPILGSIPFIGKLFRYEGTNANNIVRVFLIEPREIDERMMNNANEAAVDARAITQQMVKNKEINDELLQKWIKTYLNREVVGG
ncbi:EscC/YscC/HrcC family type III secretion system outer membrane ring protein [Escherichia coli]|nr:EscC/YscC/HrcC family type III secretion system outer membrane ring protein [Escherichia coli]EHS6968968.1 EscC/YscC/HrcC family type III secretion system outer membrane ring protein [Escherichia coli]EIT0966804.1 EscC/YscC/HrcC family type III secretion system outer membrane ring protein [Escherichia coli]EJV5988219.1 EscC/YscC/HrcC family type III secretion system outer membrane ring protein [Escherichia coli]EKH1755972.1 EscC/YscC/HrcC family type III secretion system outer membrane ring 